MEGITFSIDYLTARDRKVYESMNDQEQQDFQKLWIQIEEHKRKLKQLSNSSKLRIHRETYATSKKERKERAHRLIGHGALMEAYIDGLSRMKPEDVEKIVQTAASCDQVQTAIQNIQKRKEQ